jgi:hypothetical protein
MPSLSWTLARLRAMSAAEIAWRAGRVLQARMERAGRGTVADPPPPTLQPTLQPTSRAPAWGRSWLAASGSGSGSGFDAARHAHAAERILAGHVDLFALHDAPLGFPPRWNRDPKTGIEAPPVFGKSLDYRDETLVGDIKYLWQLNRHHELVTLAQAFHLCGRERYAHGCRRLLESWFEQCRYPLGPNWSCPLEHGIRLVNWSAAWHLLGGPSCFLFERDGDGFRRRWLASIFRHCHFIAANLSRFSSANNHLLGEYMGLFIGAVTWPCWKHSLRWRKLARRGLEEEALRQNGADGVNLEQATWYHHEVADMLLLCALCGRRNDIAFSGAYWTRLEAMLDFIHAAMDVAGNVPMIGDADDAVMVRFSTRPDFAVYRSLLATGAVIFRRRDFRAKAGLFDEKSRWLTGDIGAEVFDALPADSSRTAPRAFIHGGYYVLGADFDSATEVKIVADAGPLGYLSIAAHGHADALAFTLCAGGKELLIDPGTYAYHTQGRWRQHFRSTAAHNTVRIDGLDQSVMSGNFMWRSKARARCESWRCDADIDCLVASHDGYERLADPVTHRRTLRYAKRERMLTVEDALHCRARHEVEIWWHFPEACEIDAGAIRDGRVLARNGRARLEIELPGGEAALLRGSDDPPAGWISRRFDEKSPSPSICWKGTIYGAAVRTTRIRVGFE